MRSTAYKKQGASDRRSLIQQKKLMLFTHVAPRTKSMGLPIYGPLFSKKTYTFYTRSTAYKKQGAPDLRSLTQQKTYTFYTRSTAYKKQEAPYRRSTHLLLLLAHALPRTKNKWLHRYVCRICYLNNQVFKIFCSSAGVIIP
jgi:hypothetical protein